MTLKEIQQKIEKLAVVYRDQDFKNNPSGYHVADYVNSHTTEDAFLAGAIAMRKLIEQERVGPLRKALETRQQDITCYACSENFISDGIALEQTQEWSEGE